MNNKGFYFGLIVVGLLYYLEIISQTTLFILLAFSALLSLEYYFESRFDLIDEKLSDINDKLGTSEVNDDFDSAI